MGIKLVYKPGEYIGNLKYIKEAGYSKKNRKAYFECPECGNHFIAFVSNAKKGNHTKSCGCVTSKLKSKAKTIHQRKPMALYFAWHDLKNRCFNENYTFYHRYGGRGISVCEEWINNFAAFRDFALSNGWEKGLVIDRINNDGNYEPSNCRFVTQKINARNTSKNVMTTEKVREIKTIIKRHPGLSNKKIADKYNCSRTTIYDIRIGKTWKEI